MEGSEGIRRLVDQSLAPLNTIFSLRKSEVCEHACVCSNELVDTIEAPTIKV